METVLKVEVLSKKAHLHHEQYHFSANKRKKKRTLKQLTKFDTENIIIILNTVVLYKYLYKMLAKCSANK